MPPAGLAPAPTGGAGREPDHDPRYAPDRASARRVWAAPSTATATARRRANPCTGRWCSRPGSPTPKRPPPSATVPAERPAGGSAACDHRSSAPRRSARARRPLDADADTVRRTYETNVFGVVAVTRALLPLIQRSAAGRIVNVSSAMGSLGEWSDPGHPVASGGCAPSFTGQASGCSGRLADRAGTPHRPLSPRDRAALTGGWHARPLRCMLESNGPGPDPRAVRRHVERGEAVPRPASGRQSPSGTRKGPDPVTNWGQDEVRAFTHDCRRRRGAVSVRWRQPARQCPLAAIADGTGARGQRAAVPEPVAHPGGYLRSRLRRRQPGFPRHT